MRLRETRELLRKYRDKLELDYEQRKDGRIALMGVEKLINNINALAKLGFFDADIERLKQYPNVYYGRSTSDIFIVEPALFNTLNGIFQSIIEKVDAILKVLDISIPEQRENIISVKLPDYKELDELSDFFKNLDLALRCGLKVSEVNGDYSLENFDTGSMWVDVFFSASSLVFFGKLLELTVNYRKSSTELEITRKNLELLAIQSEHQASLKEAIEKQLKLLADQQVKLLQEDGKNYDQDSLASIRKSIQLLSDLINKGTQFHPPLDAPKEVTQSFPESLRTELLETSRGLLEDVLKSDNE
ncbi:hypothetical protein MOE00_08340 [Bacillus inaquosorum]|uniref:hypothetical protein n=1 Tax=Bacillus inaquosorum TaxID=483913 RepID=UPI0022809432|nr:hypothetical protein [Bacillus inaquosorum]MCY8792324.1 hypothetical protein [Bacillus inaquosorum]